MATLLGGASHFFQKIIKPVSSFISFGGEKSYLTLDIGTSSVKMLETQEKGGMMNIISAGIEPLPPDAVKGSMIQDPESVALSIRTLIETHQIETTDVITSVPGPLVVIKRATFPEQAPKELRETILFEAGNFIPESLDDVNIDYQVLEHDEETNNVDVLLVAVRKDMLKGYASAIGQAGLVPVIVDVDYFALENMFELNYDPNPEETIALINIGAHYSSINIVKEGRSVFTGDVPIGGQQFTTLLAQELSVDEEQAEEFKVGDAIAEDQEAVQRIVTLAVEQFLDEVQRSLSFFWSGSTKDQLNTIYISGGTAQLPGLAATMQERLDVPTEVIDPFRLLNIGDEVDDFFLRQYSASFAVSVGLASRRPGDK